MDAIANDYFDEKIKGKHKVDVMLGGGVKTLLEKIAILQKSLRNLVIAT